MVTQAEAEAKTINVPLSIIREAEDLAEVKLTGRRIVVRDDPRLRRAIQVVFNRPEFLRGRQLVLGRGNRPGASPLRGRVKQIELPPKKVFVARRPVPVKRPIRFTERPIVKKIISISDVVSGRAITRGRISKDQQRINKDIDEFNKRFGGRQLSESQFTKAQEQSSKLDKEQESLNKRQKSFEKSRAKKIGDIVIRTEDLIP